MNARFSPGVTLGFLTASLLTTVQKRGLQMVEQAQIANTDFWNWREEPLPDFAAFRALPEKLQERVAGGFAPLARRGDSTS